MTKSYKENALELITERIEWLRDSKNTHDIIPTYYNCKGMAELLFETKVIDEFEYDRLCDALNNAI